MLLVYKPKIISSHVFIYKLLCGVSYSHTVICSCAFGIKEIFDNGFLSNFSSIVKLYWEVRNHVSEYKAFSFSSMEQYNGEKRLSSNKLQLLNFFIKEKNKKQACFLDSVLVLLCTLFKKGKEEGG